MQGPYLMWRLVTVLIVALPIMLISACGSGTGDLTARLTAANLVAASTAQGLASAVEAKAIRPDSATAKALLQTLDAVTLSLESASSALRAGLPEVAKHNLDAAELQLSGLTPALPGMGGGL